MVVLEYGSLFQEQGKFFGRRYALFQAVQQGRNPDLFEGQHMCNGDDEPRSAWETVTRTSEDKTSLTFFAVIGSTVDLTGSFVGGAAVDGPGSDDPLSCPSPLRLPSELMSAPAASVSDWSSFPSSTFKLLDRSR